MYELRIHISPGYRIYFGKDEDKIILLLLGGTQGNQKKIFKNRMNIGKIIFYRNGGKYEKK